MPNTQITTTYSATLRDLRKNHPEQVEDFMESFKQAFEQAVISDIENPEEVSLLEAYQKNQLKAESYQNELAFIKLASETIELGDPRIAGKDIANVIKFLTKKIKSESRPEALRKLRDKIWHLSEINMATKKTPSSASLGQSLTFIKTVLNGHSSNYIRQVLEHIVRNLY